MSQEGASSSPAIVFSRYALLIDDDDYGVGDGDGDGLYLLQ